MTAFRKILAEVDPRSQEQLAVERLRQLYRSGTVSVKLLLCDCMDATIEYVAAGDDLQDAQADYVKRLERWLGEQAGRLDGQDVETRLVWHAPRYEAILDEAEADGADLVMRTARHHSKFERLFVSATDWELVRRAPQTVWLVKKKPANADKGLRVLAAVDPVHSEERKVGLDQRVLAIAAELAAPDGGSLRLFHAWQPGLAMAPAIAASPHVPLPVLRVDTRTIDRLRAERQSMLAELGAGAGLPESRTHLVEGAVSDALVELVDEFDIDVVVTGGLSRSRLERLIIGNTAEAILEHADCDVVVVKPSRSSDEEEDRR